MREAEEGEEQGAPLLPTPPKRRPWLALGDVPLDLLCRLCVHPADAAIRVVVKPVLEGNVLSP